jgi:cytochrome bd-type quinol oxidase subunit 2
VIRGAVMNATPQQLSAHDAQIPRRRYTKTLVFRTRLNPALLWLLLFATPSRASFLSEGALDTAAEVLSWVVLVVVPIVAIVGFLFVHILPEKFAEKKRHPQLSAIKTLCFLSLVFGGLLWPLAWLWAFTKPVLYKQAYGTDVSPEPEPTAPAAPVSVNREV